MRRIRDFALAMAVALLAATPALAESRIALVIGNGNYDARLGRLVNPVNDAKAVATALRRAGFDVDVETDLDQRAMKRAIVKLGQRLRDAGADATGLFYYGGHGLQVEGENYLVPVGADIEAEADADVEAVAAKGVLAQMEEAANAVNIVILDACRNTPVLRKFRGTDRGLARMEAPAGSFIAYSTAPGEVADDGNGANSPFAAALVAQLGRPGEPIDDIFINVRRQVLADTHNRQTPWSSSSLVSKFFFVPDHVTVDMRTLPSPVDPQTVEIAFWNGVSNSNDAGVLQSYLDRYPNGLFASAARAKIAAIDKAAKQAANPLPQFVLPPNPPPQQVASLAPAVDGKAQDDICTKGTGQARIDACSWVLQSGRYSGADQAWALSNRGVAYMDDLHQYQTAIQDYDRALALNANFAAAYHNRGIAYDDLHQFARAIQDYDHAIALKPDYIEALNNRGNAYDDLGQHERAIQDYDSALRVQPDYAIAFNNRGTAYYGLGQYTRAIQDYDRAIALNPNYAQARNNRALAYQKLGKPVPP